MLIININNIWLYALNCVCLYVKIILDIYDTFQWMQNRFESPFNEVSKDTGGKAGADYNLLVYRVWVVITK